MFQAVAKMFQVTAINIFKRENTPDISMAMQYVKRWIFVVSSGWSHSGKSGCCTPSLFTT